MGRYDLGATVTNYPKLGGLRQQKLVSLQFGGGAEIQNQRVGRAVLGAQFKGGICCLLQLLIEVRVFWLEATPLQSLPLWSHCLRLCCQTSLCLPVVRMHGIAFRAHLGNTESSLPLKIFNHVSKVLFFFAI